VSDEHLIGIGEDSLECSVSAVIINIVNAEVRRRTLIIIAKRETLCRISGWPGTANTVPIFGLVIWKYPDARSVTGRPVTKFNRLPSDRSSRLAKNIADV
jgi:hypothetical protein